MTGLLRPERLLPMAFDAIGQGDVLVAGDDGILRNRRLDHWDVAWSGAVPYLLGASYASMTVDSTDAINDAVTTATALGVKLVARGQFKITGTVTIDTFCDLSGADFKCSDTSLAPAVRLGTTDAGVMTWRTAFHAPGVIQAAKTTTGWTGASVGLELCNLYRCQVDLQRINGFTTGLLLTTVSNGVNDVGCANNLIRGGHLDNNQVNIHLLPGDAQGFTNQNTFQGIGCSHNSDEGAAVSGTRHVVLESVSSYAVNGNVFDACSFESPGVVEWQVLGIGAQKNAFLDCRWEYTGSTPKVSWDQLDATVVSKHNVIAGGYEADEIVPVTSANSSGNEIDTTLRKVFDGGLAGGSLLHLRNLTSSSGAVVRVYDVSTDPLTAGSTDWLIQLAAANIKTKAKAHAEAAHTVTTNTGLHEWGNGTNPVDVSLGRGAADRLTMGAGDAFRTGGIAALPAASSAYRGYMLRVEGGAGVADALYICEKDAADAYAWRAI